MLVVVVITGRAGSLVGSRSNNRSRSSSRSGTRITKPDCVGPKTGLRGTENLCGPENLRGPENRNRWDRTLCAHLRGTLRTKDCTFARKYFRLKFYKSAAAGLKSP